jgi:hypothetical protein
MAHSCSTGCRACSWRTSGGKSREKKKEQKKKEEKKEEPRIPRGRPGSPTGPVSSAWSWRRREKKKKEEK